MFIKGKSGNPGGRPKGLARDVKEKYGKEAFHVLLTIMRSKARGMPVKERREAAKSVLEYCWGKPVQQVDLGEETLEAIEFIRRGPIQTDGDGEAESRMDRDDIRFHRNGGVRSEV